MEKFTKLRGLVLKYILPLSSLILLISSCGSEEDIGVRRYISYSRSDLNEVASVIAAEIVMDQSLPSKIKDVLEAQGGIADLKFVVKEVGIDIDPKAYPMADLNGELMRIRFDGGDFLLWTIGYDRIDDAGDGDDLLIRVLAK